MKIADKHRDEIADRFEDALDQVKRLDAFPFYRKREAAIAAARTAWEYLQENNQ